MGETYSVEAILSAQDEGFTSLFGKAEGLLGGLDKGAGKVKNFTGSMIGANLAANAIGKGFSFVTSGVGDMMGELNSSAKAWKTFGGNMRMIGKSEDEIKAAQSSMQDYATKTIYSASDMAQTYSQMAAIGVEDSESLVKGMGGIAASAEDPQQAMKTLSQQMVQAMTKPQMSWQDFKLMLEQAPAGMSAVAEHMGMSLDDLVWNIQKGYISSKDFADAVAAVGTNEEFSEMATKFKTVDQAMDGLQETLANKLMPTFDILTDIGIEAVSGISDAIEGLDFNWLNDTIKGIVGEFKEFGLSFEMADGVSHLTQLLKSLGDIAREVFAGMGINSAKLGKYLGDALGWINQFVMSFKLSGAAQKFNQAIRAIGEAVAYVFGSIFGDASVNASDLGVSIGNIIGKIADFTKGIADWVKTVDPNVIKGIAKAFAGLFVGFKGLKFASKLKGIFSLFKKNPLEAITGGTRKSGGIISKIFTGIGKVAKDLGTGLSTVFKGIGTGLKSTFTGMSSMFRGLGTGISTAAKGIGTGIGKVFEGFGKGVSKISPAQWLGLAVAIIAVGVAVYIVAKAFDVLADVAIKLNDAGLGAQLMFAGLLVGIGALVAIFAVFGKALSANIVGMVGFAAVFLLIAAGIALIATQGEGLKLIFEGIGSGIATIVLAIGEALSGLVTAISEGVATIITAATPLVDIVGSYFIQFAQIVSDTIVKVVEALAPYIPEVTSMVETTVQEIPKIIEAFTQLLDTVGENIKGIIDSVSGLVSEIGPVLESAGQMFKDLGEGIESALSGAKEVLDGFAGIVEKAFEGASGFVESFGEAIDKTLGGVKDIIDEIGNTAVEMSTAFETLSNSLIAIGQADLDLAGMAIGIAAVASAVGQFADKGLDTTGSSLKLISDALVGMGDISELSTHITNLGNALGSFPDVSGAADKLVSLGEALAGLSDITIIAEGFTSITKALTTLSEVSTTTFNNIVLASETAMNQTVMNITDGMNRSIEALRVGFSQMTDTSSSGFRDIISNAQSFKTDFIAVFDTLPSTMEQIGVNVGEGLNNGLISQESSIMATAQRIADGISKTVKDALDVNSPSRVATWLTEMFGAGLVKGLVNSMGIVQKASEAIASVIPRSVDSASVDVGVNGRMSSMNGGQVSGHSTLEDKMDELIELTRKGKSIYINEDKLIGATGDGYDEFLGSKTEVGGRRRL
ncbi:tape measure protein [Globicatella sulfidifaciens]